MTYDEFMKLDDDQGRYELIEGELVLNRSLWTPQAQCKVNLILVLHLYLEARGGGKGYPGPVDVMLSDTTVLTPDLLVVLDEHASIINPLNIQGAPDIVIEILSDLTRERDEIKRRLYDQYGVAECWMVDPYEECVTINGRAMSVITSPLLPGFSLEVSKVFEGA